MAGGPPKSAAPFEKKGEVHELRLLLRSAANDRDRSKKRDAIKKVIAYMTLGIDVSPLFSEMVMASATSDLVQKKMVYLYLVNYAESNSELAILAINTLQKDTRDEDPMIRGLALRSLCSLNLSNTVEYLQPAVQRALEDVNGYVRKTAVIGAVKLFHISSAAVLETDILTIMRRMVLEADAHVVANAIYAIEEVLVDEGGLEPTREMILSLLNRLGQFSEWGQCAVLRLLTKYQVASEEEMFDIMNVLDALLKQSSSAVVLSVTKIFLDLTGHRQDLLGEVLRRLKGPLLTLMAAPTPELAYTVLVHVQAICQRGGVASEVFGAEYKQFFCRYNEPSYIKTVKIDIMTMIADTSTAEAIVYELSEYVTDVDATISRQAIQAIGKIAVRIPITAEMIVGCLMELLELDIDYVSTEAIVVLKDLVRKYPDQFQRSSQAVNKCLKIITEPEGKCAVLWILGEYGRNIEDAPYLLEPMIEGFLEESSGAVRLQMLTATVKLFFERPPEVQAMLGRLLTKAIQETSHPDVRDRAILYYRLLEISVSEAERVICAPREVACKFTDDADAEFRDRGFEEFNTLGTVYRQSASKFVLGKVPSAFFGATKMNPPPGANDGYPDQVLNGGGMGGYQEEPDSLSAPAAPAMPSNPPADMMADLLGEEDPLGLGAPAPAAPVSPASPVDDLLGIGDLLGGGPPSAPAAARPAFSLAADPNMDGASFQQKWGVLQAWPVQHRPRKIPSAPMSTGAVEAAVRRIGINVIASGETNGILKFYFYARQASGPDPIQFGGEVWFLVELLISSDAVQLTLKGESAAPASMESFLATIWGALGDFVAS